jgi:hypothetical protein
LYLPGTAPVGAGDTGYAVLYSDGDLLVFRKAASSTLLARASLDDWTTATLGASHGSHMLLLGCSEEYKLLFDTLEDRARWHRCIEQIVGAIKTGTAPERVDVDGNLELWLLSLNAMLTKQDAVNYSSGKSCIQTYLSCM